MMKLLSSKLTPVIVLVALAFGIGSFTPAALAQTPVTGSADFRNAPQLPPGRYIDRIVTGDTAWYALAYTNGTPYEFAVSFAGATPGRDVQLSARFVAPTLTTVDGPGAIVSGDGVDYPAGHTNIWFLKVSLESTGQLGVEYPIVIEVDGVQAFGSDDCSDIPGCVLDDEYAQLNVELAQAQARLDEQNAQETVAAVTQEIENLQGFAESSATLGPAAQSRLARAEAQMTELCGGEPECEVFPDPGSKTPIVGWLFGLLVLGGGAYRAFKRFTADPTAKDEKEKPAPRTPASLARSRS